MARSPLAPHWLSYPDNVNALNPKLWAGPVARNASGELCIDSVPVSDLAERFGTPLFVLSERDFRARAQAFRDAFRDAFAAHNGADVYYAGKAFLCVSVAQWMNELGLRIDTCSGGELAVALAAGVAPANIGLHGNNKSDAELGRALELGLGRIVVDSLDELRHLDALAAEHGKRANVLLRLTPGVHAHTHEFIATAHEDQKFGLSLQEDERGDSPALRAARLAHESPNINLLGLHSHIGSQIFDASGFELAATTMMSFLARLNTELGVQLPELDLGGGYGISYLDSDDPREIAEVARSIAAVVVDTAAELGLDVPRVSVEPGRAIAGPSTFTLYRAGVAKEVAVPVIPDAESDVTQHDGAAAPGAQSTPTELATRRYLSVDGGMSDNPRPVLYDADYTAVLASRVSESEPVMTRVVGKHCESGDIVVRDAYLPADVTRGDLIAVPSTGAYCWVLSSNYNLLGRPPVVAVREGEARVIVRGESIEDVLSRDAALS